MGRRLCRGWGCQAPEAQDREGLHLSVSSPRWAGSGRKQGLLSAGKCSRDRSHPLPRCGDRLRLPAQGDPSLSVYGECVHVHVCARGCVHVCACGCLHVCARACSPFLSVYEESVCVCV